MTVTIKAPLYSCRKSWTGVTRDVDERRNAGHQLELPCEFHSTDPSEFVAHMKAVHGGGVTFPSPAWKRLPNRLWTGPRLTDEGKPFEPTGLDVGATVTWRQLVPTGDVEHTTRYDSMVGESVTTEHPVMEWVERTGQVWSKGDRGVWVIPDDESPDEAELAVLVRPSTLTGRLEEHGVFRGTAARAAA